MNNASKCVTLPALTVDLLQASGVLINNVCASLWKQLGMKTLLACCCYLKHTDIPLAEVIYSLPLIIQVKQTFKHHSKPEMVMPKPYITTGPVNDGKPFQTTSIKPKLWISPSI